MKEVIDSFAALPMPTQVIAALFLSTLLAFGRSAWYRLFYRKGWYLIHNTAFHLPPILIIAFLGGVVMSVSEQLGWIFILPTVIYFILFDAGRMKEQRKQA